MTSTDVVAVTAVSSYAHRSRGDIHVVMDLPGRWELEGNVLLRLRSGSRTIRTPALGTRTESGVRLETRVNAGQLSPGLWRVSVRSASGAGWVRMQARIQLKRKQPIALLTGPLPRTRMAEPTPSRKQRPRTRQFAVRVVDRALTRLPERQAASLRTTLRKAAHRILR